MNINLRSPYFVFVTGTGLIDAIIEIEVYTGVSTGTIVSPQYTLNSTATSDNISFEISELIRDFIDISFDGSYSSEVVWVNYRVTYNDSGGQTIDPIQTLLGFDGYGYFEEGINPQLAERVLQTNSIIIIPDEADLSIPVNSALTDEYKLFLDGVEVLCVDIPTSTDTADQIYYAINSIYSIDNYTSRVVSGGGAVEAGGCQDSNIKCDSVKFYISTSLREEIDVRNMDVCKYTPYEVTFVNKFGAFQSLWFMGRSVVSLKRSNDTYKSNTLDVPGQSYSINSHQKRSLNVSGIENISLNTGFVDQSFDAVIRELLLSESVWIDFENNTLPVNVKSSSVAFKDTLTEKVINYSIDFEFAFDKINTIR